MINNKQRNAATLHDNSKKKATIIINTEHLERPNLSVARTLLHEMMHAEIYRILWDHMTKSAGKNKIYYNKSDLDKNKGNFGKLIEYYENFKEDQAQHEFIAEEYRYWIMVALAEYANKNDIVFNSKDLIALSWEGLKGTKAWSNLDKETKEIYNETLDDFNNDTEKMVCK